jgi:hypothetical protein
MQIFRAFSWLRWVLAALYAATLLAVSPGICESAMEGWRAPVAQSGVSPRVACHDEAKHGQDRSKNHASCCDACTPAPSARVDAAHISSLVLRIEIATCFDFENRLGRDLDNGPGDLRCRAPPHLSA